MRFLGVSVCVALAVWLGFMAVTQAAPVDLKQVPADAKWVVHVDVDAIRASTVVRNAYKKSMEMHPEAAAGFDLAKKFVGMNPREDLHGITLYDKVIGKPEGVVIVAADIDQKPLLALVEKAPDHKVVKSGDYELHTWTDKHHGNKTVAGAFYKGGIAFAEGADALKAALDLIGGKGSNAVNSALAGPVPPGTTVLVRVTGIKSAGLPCKSPIVKQMESARIVMGENNGESFFKGKAVMTNPEIASQVKTILEGGKALASLQAGGDVQLKKMVDALKITTEGNTLRVLWAAPANDVWDVAQKVAKKIIEEHGKFGSKKGPWQHKHGTKEGGDKKGCPPGCKCPKCQKGAKKPAPPVKKAPTEEF